MSALPVFWNEAVEPATKDGLLKALRLEQAISGNIAEAVDAELQGVRVDLYVRLGEEVINQLLALTYEENPTTLDGVLRLRASELERLMLKVRLLVALPTLFLDSSGSEQMVWNEDGFSRNTGNLRLDDLIKALQDKITNLIDEIINGGLDSGGGVKVEVIGPEEPFVAGSSLRRQYSALERARKGYLP